jgi:hypothetical protein
MCRAHGIPTQRRSSCRILVRLVSLMGEFEHIEMLVDCFGWQLTLETNTQTPVLTH